MSIHLYRYSGYEKGADGKYDLESKVATAWCGYQLPESEASFRASARNVECVACLKAQMAQHRRWVTKYTTGLVKAARRLGALEGKP